MTRVDEREAPGGGVRRRPWHALAVDEVLARLDVDLERGLTGEEAARRLGLVGPNELAADEPPTNLQILLRQFKSPLIAMLLGAAVVTIAIDEYIDTGVIVAVLVLNAAVGFVQERKPDRSVRALMELAAPSSRAVRDGRDQDVDSRALVPGDVVLLDSGTRVPADLRLAATTALQVDESLLTGESLPVSKRIEPVAEAAGAADRANLAHMGSIVASGRGPRPGRRHRCRHRAGEDRRADPHSGAPGEPAHAPDAPLRRDHRRGRRGLRSGDAPPGRGHGGTGRRGVHDRCGPRGRHRARGPAGRAHRRAGPRPAADGAAQRDHPHPSGRGDTGQREHDRLGQDRHPDAEPHDRAAGVGGG